MEEKLDKILELSKKTHDKINKEDGWFLKVLHISEKLIVPLMLGILAYVANSASNNISQSQLKLSNAQLSLAQAEAARNDEKHRSELRAKYIEIFMKEVSSDDEVRQKYALSLLNVVDNSLAQEMSYIIEKNRSLSKAVSDEITIIRQTARNTKVAQATGRSGNWKRYEACVTIPEGAVMDNGTVKSRVIGGVGAGSWGNWEGDFRYIGTNQVCRTFAHQIHDQDRLLEITVEYEIESQS